MAGLTPDVVPVRVVLIEWADACDVGAGEWVAEGTAVALATIQTVGWLIEETAEHYAITHSLGDDLSARGVFVIPRSAVLGISDLS